MQSLNTETNYAESILNHLPYIIYISDLQGNVLYYNRIPFHLKGDSEDYLNKPCSNFETPLCKSENCAKVRFKKGYTKTVFQKNACDYQVETSELKDQDGSVIGYIHVLIDVTNENAESSMIQSLAHHLPVGIFCSRLDDDLTLIYSNEHFYEMHGTTQKIMNHTYQNKLSSLINQVDFTHMKNKLLKSNPEDNQHFEFEIKTNQTDGHVYCQMIHGLILNFGGVFVFSAMAIDITKLHEANEKLKLSEERFRIALSQMKSSIWEYDIQTKSIDREKSSIQISNSLLSLENIPYSLIESEMIHPDFADTIMHLYHQLQKGVKKCSCVIKSKLGADNVNYHWTKISYVALFDQQGTPVKAIGISEDIDDASLNQVPTLEDKYREAISSGIIATYEVNLSKNIILNGNMNFDTTTKYIDQPYSIFVNQAKYTIVCQGNADFFEQAFRLEALIKAYQNGTHEVEVEYQRHIMGGSTIWVEASAHMMQEKESGDICAFIVVRDIHDIKMKELALKESLKRDALTGLYHRNAFQELVDDLIASHPNTRHMLMMLDIDNFKGINDNFGHAYGDEVLIDISKKLNEFMTDNDFIGRIGGDEFVILTLNVENDEQILERAKKICELMHLSYSNNKNDYPISASIGIAYYHEHGKSFQELYENADLALYQAKTFGKNQYAVYDKRMATMKSSDWMNKEWIVDELDEIIYISDPETYEVYYLNRNGRKITGIGTGDYVGKKCYKVMQNRDEPCPFCTNSQIKYNEFLVWEYHNEYLNRHFMLKDKLVTWNGKPARMEFALDVTEKENVSLDLQKKLMIESTLVQCISSLVSINDLDEAINLVLHTIGQFYQADRAYIFEMDREKGTCTNTYEWCNEGIITQMENLQELSMEENRFWSQCFHSKKSIVLNDIIDLKKEYPNEFELLKNQNIQSIYCVPFELKNSLGGVIGIDNARINQGDITLLDNLSYMVINEISKRRLNSNLEFISYHDSLTNLMNRNKYHEYLAYNDGDHLESVGVMIADINGLKYLNQNFGHNTGDQCVIQTAKIVSQFFQKEDLFRLNGDEFVGFLKNVDRNVFVSQMQKLRILLADLDIGSVSIGYTWSDDDIELDRMIAHADELMYIEKQNYYANNENGYTYSHPKRITDLVTAITNRNFMMYLQPKFDLKNDVIGGCEALVRYQHEEFGVIFPNKFIPILEKEKTIRYVDFFIFEEVCRVLEKWKNENRKLIPISLNFSRLTMLEDDLIHTLIAITNRYHVDRSYIEIEITETIGEMERETIAEISKKLQEQGFSISLDDFGSKFTSMSMLTFMKFKVLKIDRSLVSHIVSSPEERIVVRYVLEMCRELGIQSVAEGVETEEQLNLLKAMNCDYVQGFLFDKPLPLVDFERRYFTSTE